MTLAADRRGRVPFALVGVLLLLGASAYGTGVTTRGPTTVDRDAAAAGDAVVRDVRPALRTAVEQATAEAARNPVTAPADTPAGRVLNDSTPFRDALRLRIALAAAESLRTVHRRQGDAVATASLPPVRTVASLRDAKRRVRVASLRGGTAMQVTLRNVTVTVREADRVVSRERLTVRLTVGSPVLALHDRTVRFERRLNREPLAGPGVGRGLTARLYPVAWARGYAHYAGAPVSDVLGNHHVELATNTAILRQQRAAFGRVDPDGPAAVEVATARVLARDLLVPAGTRADEAAARAVGSEFVLPAGALAGEAAAGTLRPTAVTTREADFTAGRRDDSLTVSPAAAADGAFLQVAEPETLRAVLRDSYRAEARLTTVVDQVSDGRRPRPVSPGENWTLVDATTTVRTTVSTVPGSTSRSADGRGAVFRTGRVVTVHHEVSRVWRHRDGQTRRVERTWLDRSRVTVAVVVRHAGVRRAPARPVEPLFRRGGALDGPNLDDALPRARSRLLAGNGGVDRVARHAARGQALTRNATVVGERPAALEPWVYRDLRRLHRRVRNVTVQVSRERVAAGRANPPSALAAALRDRRQVLLDAPPTYDGAADHARLGVRAAYLDAVLRRLDRRAAEVDRRNRDYVSAVGADSAAELSRLAALSDRQDARRNGTTEGAVAFVPDGSPAYLSVTAVERAGRRGAAYHPLAVRTLNWFALPHGDAGEAAGSVALDGRDVDLASAGQALVAADTVHNRRPDATLGNRRDRLDAAVGASMSVVRRRLRTVVREETGYSRRRSDRIVRDGLRRWDGRGHRALAAANGSLATAVAAEARERGVAGRAADRLAVRLRVVLRGAVDTRSVRVPAAVTNRTATATRRVASGAAEELTAAGLERAELVAYERWRRTGARSLPAGLPVAPVPGYWYATVNAWSVTVRGEYRRFAVRAPVGAPDGGGAVVRYVRDGSTVRLDVDGDGVPERLGRSERVAFTVSTTVVVAVPPGPPGVGDTDGDRDERSPGWPCPGPAGDESCAAERGPGE